MTHTKTCICSKVKDAVGELPDGVRLDDLTLMMDLLVNGPELSDMTLSSAAWPGRIVVPFYPPFEESDKGLGAKIQFLAEYVRGEILDFLENEEELAKYGNG